MKIADPATILRSFEHESDGSWRCVAEVTLETPEGPVAVEPGMRLSYGQDVGGLDVAEYLEQLGAQFGS